ncbi:MULTISPECIES: L-aspartate oxidase [unclassified Brevibacterium]|uniref:L-aspartate oxidase n=1 Tax=unclassified Brevibacterium TaxID=2614124 RepID=UPI001091AAF2|nr:L-aspartate oxidase [Brevibacterium sp. S22]TGD29859.1 L-aspartate oxidase [Brevibacterium sp. S22]
MSGVIVAGSGIAGLTAALHLSGRHPVTLVTKGRLGESNTEWAQGGIAGVIGPDDTVDAHVFDTLTAGAGHCDPEAVRILCEAGGDAIIALAEAGVDFDADPTGAWARCLEGAHSHPRIFHSGGDATGRAISTALAGRLRAEVAAGRVTLLENTVLVDVLTDDDERLSARATGVTVLRSGRLDHLSADAIVLATGGAGQLFAHTTNPVAATGDGLAAAIRAGAEVADLEFFQFHPTALVGPGFLISEAVRGAGALLLDERGRRFMFDIDDRGELASRDVVALALHRRQAAQDGRPCFLDARAVPDAAAKFPSISAGLAAHGLDLSRDLIPVTPAAHYFMGGVATDRDGHTSIAGLFAIGEAACTRVHGANRLASNSLLEGAVFAARAAAAIDAHTPTTDLTTPRTDLRSGVSDSLHHLPFPRFDSLHQTALTRTELQALTWAHLGVERTAAGLRTLLDRLGEGREVGHDERALSTTGPAVTSVEELETANLALIAEHMARQALAREHSLGAHTRTDTTITPSTARLQEATAC